MILSFILAKLAIIPALAPILSILWMVVGLLHTCIRPLFDLLHLALKQLPSHKPEEELEQVEKSNFMKMLFYIVDRLSGLGPKG